VRRILVLLLVLTGLPAFLSGVAGQDASKIKVQPKSPFKAYPFDLKEVRLLDGPFRQAMLLSQGSLGILWSNWLVGSITTLALLLLVWPLFSRVSQMLKGAGGSNAAARGTPEHR